MRACVRGCVRACVRARSTLGHFGGVTSEASSPCSRSMLSPSSISARSLPAAASWGVGFTPAAKREVCRVQWAAKREVCGWGGEGGGGFRSSREQLI